MTRGFHGVTPLRAALNISTPAHPSCPTPGFVSTEAWPVEAWGGAPTESTRVEGGFELLVRVPWTK
jgi:hypothetical protein